MSINDFVGKWTSSGWHTNPYQQDRDDIKEAWPLRTRYYPVKGVEFEACIAGEPEPSLTHPKHAEVMAFLNKTDPGLPTPPPTRVCVIKFTVLEPTKLPTNIIFALESADYHYFEGGNYLVSTPIFTSSQTWFVDIIEMLPPGTPIPGGGHSVYKAMRHNLLWHDGLRTKWICCPYISAPKSNAIAIKQPVSKKVKTSKRAR